MKHIRCMIAGVLTAAAIAAAATPLAAQQAPDGGAWFHVERNHDSGAASGGRSMILIPGLLSGGEVWNGTVAHFGEEYDMHVLTLAGFAGVPPVRGELFLAGVRDAVIAYIRDEALDRPVLAGHSLGAFLSLWIAATAPDLVGPVIAVDGVPFLSALGDTTMTAERAAVQAEGMRTVFGGMTAEALGAQTGLAMTAQVKDTAWHSIGARWGAASDPSTVGAAMAEMMTTDLRAEVANITAPVLLFMAADGVNSEVRELIESRYRGQLDRVKDARVVVAERARHFIMLDDPEFFYATVSAFLAGR